LFASLSFFPPINRRFAIGFGHGQLQIAKGLKHCKNAVYIENNYAPVAKTPSGSD